MSHPVSIGVLNGLFPGLGYVLLRERVVFGAGLLVAMILFAFVMFTDPSSAFDTMLFAVSPVGRVIESVSYVVGVLAFGYDAYDLARKKQGAEEIVKL